jgi:beta-mannanase
VRPVIFWQPVGKDWRTQPERYAYGRIVAGDWDAYLTTWARDAAAWGDRVIVRWAHEMNAPWFPWAIGKVGNTPANYRAAWRHVVTLVRGIAPNVRFMWAPNAPCGDACLGYAELYPGDAYVNVLGFSSYNWSGDPSVSMVTMYRKTVTALMSVSKRRIVAAETGIKGPGPGRARWLREGYAGVYDAYPRLKGIIYFDIDMTIGGEPVWRLVASDDSLDGYASLQRDPRFMGRM